MHLDITTTKEHCIVRIFSSLKAQGRRFQGFKPRLLSFFLCICFNMAFGTSSITFFFDMQLFSALLFFYFWNTAAVILPRGIFSCLFVLFLYSSGSNLAYSGFVPTFCLRVLS